MAQSIPFSIIRKEAFEVENLEAIVFGRAGLLELDHEDNYYKNLKFRWEYLQNKYQLKPIYIESVQFFKLRPDNFPTMRLSQLANVYHQHQNLFSKIIHAGSLDELYSLFSVSTSPYWLTHYRFDKESSKKTKLLSKSFIDLLMINTVVPFRFAYEKSQGKDAAENTIFLLEEIASEKNNIIDKFQSIGITAKNAFETQSLLQLKNEYCNKSKCLQCSIGLELLKSN